MGVQQRTDGESLAKTAEPSPTQTSTSPTETPDAAAEARRHTRAKTREDAATALALDPSARDRWYVIQVFTGKERKVCEIIRRLAGSDVLRECFSPAYATQKKVRGEWRDVQALLFPGYVIAVTRDASTLKARLRGVPEFTKLLSMGESFTPLTSVEREWICTFTERGDRVMPMSMATVEEGDRVRVFKGPLMGREGWIRRVDRKRSTAYIELEMFGRRIQTKIGLGIVQRKPCSGEQKTA